MENILIVYGYYKDNICDALPGVIVDDLDCDCVNFRVRVDHLRKYCCRFPCSVLLALPWNANENPSTDKLS